MVGTYLTPIEGGGELDDELVYNEPLQPLQPIEQHPSAPQPIPSSPPMSGADMVASGPAQPVQTVPEPYLDPGYTLDQNYTVQSNPPPPSTEGYVTLPGEKQPYNPTTGEYLPTPISNPANAWLGPPPPPMVTFEDGSQSPQWLEDKRALDAERAPHDLGTTLLPWELPGVEAREDNMPTIPQVRPPWETDTGQLIRPDPWDIQTDPVRMPNPEFFRPKDPFSDHLTPVIPPKPLPPAMGPPVMHPTRRKRIQPDPFQGVDPARPAPIIPPGRRY